MNILRRNIIGAAATGALSGSIGFPAIAASTWPRQPLRNRVFGLSQLCLLLGAVLGFCHASPSSSRSQMAAHAR